MAKGSKKKNKDKKDSSKGALPGKVAKRLRDISKNPLIADIVAATLVGAAAALKDSKKARQLAVNAGDELEALAARGAKQGNALWQLALDVGQKSIEALGGDASPKARKAKAKAKPRPRAAAPKRAKSKPKSASSPKTRQSRRPGAR